MPKSRARKRTPKRGHVYLGHKASVLNNAATVAYEDGREIGRMYVSPSNPTMDELVKLFDRALARHAGTPREVVEKQRYIGMIVGEIEKMSGLPKGEACQPH